MQPFCEKKDDVKQEEEEEETNGNNNNNKKLHLVTLHLFETHKSRLHSLNSPIEFHIQLLGTTFAVEVLHRSNVIWKQIFRILFCFSFFTFSFTNRPNTKSRSQF